MSLAWAIQADRAGVAFRICHDLKRKGIKPDIIAYNSLLSACAKQDMGELCLALLEDMEPLGLKPTRESFNSVLAVCLS